MEQMLRLASAGVIDATSEIERELESVRWAELRLRCRAFETTRE
jgi:hypothetical protein